MCKNIGCIILSLITCILFNSCLNKKNSIEINFSNEINKADVSIKMEVLASIPITEIYTWQKKYNIPNGYGENEWYFTYKDSLQGYSRHIKTNRNDKHIYVFYFYREADKYFVDVNIKGVSPLQEKIELKKNNKAQ